MDKRSALKVTTDYLLQLYSFKNIPLQYLPQVEEYSKKVRRIKIKLNTKTVNKARCATCFNVYKAFEKRKA